MTKKKRQKNSISKKINKKEVKEKLNLKEEEKKEEKILEKEIKTEKLETQEDKRNNKFKEFINKHKKLLIIAMIIFVILLVLTTFYVIQNPLKLVEGDVQVLYGEEYKEIGYSAKKYGYDFTKKVKVKSNINYEKLGTYDVVYTVKILGITYKAKRIVNLVDLEKPTIILKGNENVEICPEKEYDEEGYEARDNYDGDLTDKVKIKKEQDQIIYLVEDSSKNYSEIIRKLVRQDKVNPEITLNGSNTITIYTGNAYNEQGAQATDNCDGDITGSITTEGSVDTSKPGTYKITYKVKDKTGNEASVERTIVVKNRVVVPLNDGRPGTIYLTFDDGPNEGTTNVILDILREEGVKATFFVTNNGPDYLIKREYDEGHTVALHTATHNYSIVYASDEAYYNDLYAVQDRVRRITGYTSTIIRFPGGSSNTVSRRYSPGIMSRLTQSVLERGFRYYDWNISSGDAGGTTVASGVYSNVVNSLRKDRANMVLMHDIKTYTRDAIRDIIRYGKQAGYSFERITESTPMITQGVNN